MYCGRFGSMAPYNCSTALEGRLTFPCERNKVLASFFLSTVMSRVDETQQRLWSFICSQFTLTQHCGRFGSMAPYNCSTALEGRLTFPCERNKVLASFFLSTVMSRVGETQQRLWSFTCSQFTLTQHCGRFGSMAPYNCSTALEGRLTFPCKRNKVLASFFLSEVMSRVDETQQRLWPFICSQFTLTGKLIFKSLAEVEIFYIIM